MSMRDLWLTVAFFTGSMAVEVGIAIGQPWLVHHAWIVWPLWIGFVLFLGLALREAQWFRRLFWKVMTFLVALPRESSPALEPLPNGVGRGVQTRADILGKANAQAPHLTIRITQGVFYDQSNAPNTLVLLLNVRVDGPPAAVHDWRLELRHGEKHWKTAWVQKVKGGVTDYSVPPVDLEVVDVQIIPPEVPSAGWLLFIIPSIGPEGFHHIFGATFVLTAVEDDSTESSMLKPPGEWLHRASRINYPQ